MSRFIVIPDKQFLRAVEFFLSILGQTTKQRCSSVVVTVISVAFILVQSFDVGILHVLWHCTSPPVHDQEFVQVGQKLLFRTSENFSWNTIILRSFIV